ncbi:deoxyribose-phosphate aldolase [Chloracidobacterium validum]|uniref:Deoxyribose-phosphate aldolase n=1 Tax=Chloracidobacterium validum TaxID=2821543 RepID=A0ABX8B992_9BACT|nr:deoxyribose-phosphate aldolase [Chloracidobacterium validum]QUW03502.1 deoxyribose-phosphate aldolase [Chloracidobacterium validum]
MSEIVRQPSSLAAYIDHTLLKPEATSADITRCCDEAKRYRFASVCVNPAWVSQAAHELSGQATTVCTVVGFPLGATTTEVKVFEAQQALENGAREIDMVMRIGKLKEGDFSLVEADILAVVKTVQRYNAICKVIIETSLLTDNEKVKACQIIQSSGADFVKTSTGFNQPGATIGDVKLLYQTAQGKIQIKASGGIRSREMAEQLIAAGATRLGTSNSVAIVCDEKGLFQY